MGRGSSFTETGAVVLIRLVTSKSLRRKFMRLGLQTIVFVCFFWAFGPFPLRPIAHLKLFDSASQGGISDLFPDWRSFRQASQRVPSGVWFSKPCRPLPIPTITLKNPEKIHPRLTQL